jgi:Transposase DDE domain group 1
VDDDPAHGAAADGGGHPDRGDGKVGVVPVAHGEAASAAARRPDWAASPPAPSRSTPLAQRRMLAVDLLAWAQTMLLHEVAVLAKAEPKTLRYRLLHVAARLVRGGRRLRLRLDRTWPWAAQRAAAFDRCAALPQPAR